MTGRSVSAFIPEYRVTFPFFAKCPFPFLTEKRQSLNFYTKALQKVVDGFIRGVILFYIDVYTSWKVGDEGEDVKKMPDLCFQQQSEG
ncbi:hypothetical protein J2TS4_08210 [Paenibacillus sp. J2TS4]|nr:hypothetical protein J2TS4_08210 [Paenibacillus sp. J2TS4]